MRAARFGARSFAGALNRLRERIRGRVPRTLGRGGDHLRLANR